MATSKTTAEKIELQREKMEQMENELKRLLRQQKEDDRKKRTRRICQRGELIESLLPDTIALSDERFKEFLAKTAANDFGRRALAALKADQEKADSGNTPGISARVEKTSADTPPEKALPIGGAKEERSAEPPRGGGAATAAKEPETGRMAG